MPSFYDQILAELMLKGNLPRDISKGLASEAEDEVLRRRLGGKHPWRGGRYDFVPGTSRASTAGIDRHITGKWNKAPRADLMYMHPFSPERWDDYGAWEPPAGFRMPARYFQGRRF